jgi:hypothetical protein
MELQKRINKRTPEHFFATAVPLEMLEQLGHFFIELTSLKRSKSGKAVPIAGFSDNGTTTVEQPAGAADRVA